MVIPRGDSVDTSLQMIRTVAMLHWSYTHLPLYQLWCSAWLHYAISVLGCRGSQIPYTPTSAGVLWSPGRNRNNFKFLTTAVHLSYSRTADWQLRAQCDYFGYQRTRCQSKYKIYTSGTHQLTTYGSSWLGRFHLKSWPFVALIEEFPLLQRRSHRMGCLLCLVFHLHYRCNANDANGS